MRSDRRNMPEQELSIKEREQELFLEPQEAQAARQNVKPFAVYLRETPADPISSYVRAILWAAGVIVLILLALALWRAQRSSRRRPRPRASEAAAAALFTPPRPDPGPNRHGTMAGRHAGTTMIRILLPDAIQES
jgi:hypothetical protein